MTGAADDGMRRRPGISGWIQAWRAWSRVRQGWSPTAEHSLARGRLGRMPQAPRGKVKGFAGVLLALGPWKVTLLSAMVCGLCFPPVGLGPLLLVAMAPFFAVLPRFQSARAAYTAGFLFGWIYLLIPLHWMIFMVPLNAADPPIAAMVAMWLLSCGLQMLWFLVIAAVGFHGGKVAPKLTCLVLLPVAFAAMEVGRLTLPFPGPLIHAGESLHGVSLLIQMADVGGIYLVSAFVALVNGCAALVLDRQMRGRKDGRLLAALVMVWGFLLAGGYGAWRLSSLGGELRPDGPLVVCIQPNIGQEQKNREYAGDAAEDAARTGQGKAPALIPGASTVSVYEEIPDQFSRVRAMTLDASARYPDADLFIWPETAMPGRMPAGYGTPPDRLNSRNPELTEGELDYLIRALGGLEPGAGIVRSRLGKPLLFGVETQPSQHELSLLPWLTDEERAIVRFNSVVLLDPMGQPLGRHDKHKLVPAGEYIPYRGTPLGDFASHYMRELAGYVPRVVPGTMPPETSAAGAATPFGLKDHAGAGREWRFTTNVCYEYAFSDFYQTQHAGKPVHFAVNLGNEAWYGEHAELDQAVVQTKFRAIESRASFVRCTNSGVTCVIDPMGREVSRHTHGVDGRDRLFAGVYAEHVPVFGDPPGTVWQGAFGRGLLGVLDAIAKFMAVVVAALLIMRVVAWVRRRRDVRRRRKARMVR